MNRRFVATDPSEFDGLVAVVELSDDYDRNGTVVGYGFGGEAAHAGELAAEALNRSGHQPKGLECYTVATGEDF